MTEPPQESRWPTYPGPVTPPPADPRLPATVEQSAVPVPPPPPGLVPFGRPGYSVHDPLLISAGAGGVKKEGVWTVPPYLSVHGDLGSVRLDFRRAEVTSQVIWVQVSGGAGTIVIVVPEGWAAQLDRVSAGIGTRKVTVAEEPLGSNPVLVLSGSLGMGTLKVRYPNRYDERRLRRQLLRERRGLR